MTLNDNGRNWRLSMMSKIKIEYNSQIDHFTFLWEGEMKYFRDYEGAEDWILLNTARQNEYNRN